MNESTLIHFEALKSNARNTTAHEPSGERRDEQVNFQQQQCGSAAGSSEPRANKRARQDRPTNPGNSNPHESRSNSSSSKRYNSGPESAQYYNGKNVRKRVMANERERERTKSLNQALELLRNRLPCPEAEKRSKIQTLRMAKEYIEFLAKFKQISQQQQHQQQHDHMSTQTGPTSLSFSTNATAATHDNNYSHSSSDIRAAQDHNFNHTNQTSNNNKPLSLSVAWSNNQPPQVSAQSQPPDSPLNVKFYTFRLEAKAKR